MILNTYVPDYSSVLQLVQYMCALLGTSTLNPNNQLDVNLPQLLGTYNLMHRAELNIHHIC
jgi:hypothetical protein